MIDVTVNINTLFGRNIEILYSSDFMHSWLFGWGPLSMEMFTQEHLAWFPVVNRVRKIYHKNVGMIKLLILFRYKLNQWFTDPRIHYAGLQENQYSPAYDETYAKLPSPYILWTEIDSRTDLTVLIWIPRTGVYYLYLLHSSHVDACTSNGTTTLVDGWHHFD